MRVMNITHDSVVDGEGLRTTIFFAGCPHKCSGCHNPESWDLNNGVEMSVEDVLEEIKSNPLTDVTLSGGDPFLQSEEVSILAKEINSLGKNIWIYTGYTLDELLRSNDETKKSLLHQCDVLVDGRFVLEERDISLSFKGSKNQKIYNVKNYFQEMVY